ncbi:hypothetical protein [Limnohabitans sp. TEGF004]|uniref:hypothetical protein n=1 Tax=Limnohabitans sp. TEGF004 TaxID=2986281 RepID=UPI002377AF1E|nr:hypothetical protein [Limnohabitans sp. TEGF004]BDU56969.1 hypothetical protein LTEGF4_26500 [Limnohabitans sp. TEGF004]
MKLNKQNLIAISAIAFLQVASATEAKSPNCPEVPPGAVILGKYCPQPLIATVDEPASEEAMANSGTIGSGSAQSTISGVVVVNQSVTAIPAAPVIPPLVIRQGDRLMPTLKAWLASQSIDLVWAASATTSGRVRDVVLEDDFQASAADVQTALNEVLEPFGFEAEIAKNSGAVKRVTVRNSRNGL